MEPVTYKFDDECVRGKVEVIPRSYGIEIFLNGTSIILLDLFSCTPEDGYPQVFFFNDYSDSPICLVKCKDNGYEFYADDDTLSPLWKETPHQYSDIEEDSHV